MKKILTTQEIENVFSVFQKNYELVPLEVFGSDPYKTLISTVLSARTKDETTLEASKRLFKKAPNLTELSQLYQNEISTLIFPVGFYKTKAKHLKELAHKLVENHNSTIPTTQAELLKLPGVGIKTANLTLNRAFGKPAIAVDTHVHRITNLLEWVKTDSPEQTEKALVKIIPSSYWSDMNRLFVSIGRQYTTFKRLKEFLTVNSLLPAD